MQISNFAVSNGVFLAKFIVRLIEPSVSPDNPNMNNPNVSRPTDFANLTALSTWGTVIFLLILSSTSWSALSIPKHTCQHPDFFASFKNSRSTIFTRTPFTSDQEKFNFRFRISLQISLALCMSWVKLSSAIWISLKPHFNIYSISSTTLLGSLVLNKEPNVNLLQKLHSKAHPRLVSMCPTGFLLASNLGVLYLAMLNNYQEGKGSAFKSWIKLLFSLNTLAPAVLSL